MKRNNAMDLRVIKTKKAIQGAFIQLIKEKGYQNVSVSEIALKAKINRNTFYLHYDTKDDLIKKMMFDLNEQIQNSLTFFQTLNTKNYNEISIHWGFRNILHLIKPNIAFYQVLLNDDSLRGYINNLYLVIKKFLYEWLDIKNAAFELIFEYAANGTIGLIEKWILDNTFDENKTAKILANLSVTILKQYYELNK